MPELPDVEGFRRELAETLPGRRICGVEVPDSAILRNCTAQRLGRTLSGRRFGRPDRHGKWLLLPVEGPTLLVHSGMTGRPYHARHGETDRHDRLVIDLDRGELHYADQRKLRGVWIAGDDDEAARIMGEQGPDALGLGLPEFTAALANRRGKLKPTLMDQSAVAGLGNLLTDEICWRARISPSRPVADLDEPEIRRLHTAMLQVLRTAVRHGCVPGLRRWLTRVRDRPDPSCPRCGSRLRGGRIGGRSAVWCPYCQPR
ncbi:MAG: DNA-formamidopyrimidine glycosylase family protein [Actinomycetota bacterium]|nr:DNA-formamidopyrimidine glycosylase family protein [Actinomycetota bacterium]